jgi:N-acetylglucosamine-6-phosphate deacetylase
MTMTALTGARILTPAGWRDDDALLIADECIAGIVAEGDVAADTARVVLNGGMLLPGFVDTQVNGGGGVLFNDSPTVAGIAAIARAHRTFGTTGFLPTLISDDLNSVATAIAAVDDAIMAGVPGVLGIHIEGPFLNAAKRGIHDSDKFRILDSDAVALLASLKHGKTLVTLAPELAAPGQIAALVARGVIVAAGHSLASFAAMQAAFAEGLSGVTHLFNAMSQLDSRAPGVVGAALTHDRCIAGLIVDGHHVHPATLKVALAARGAAGLMLVTDAMPSVGAADAAFSIGGRTITVVDGVCRGPDGTLAGSDLDMATAVRNAMTLMGVDLPTASLMASGVPAAFLGVGHERGALAPGMRADIVHVDDAGRVTATWIGGKA